MEYNILTARTAKDLAHRVNWAMAHGWRPFGGVSVALEGSPDHGWLVFAQAMILEVKSE